MDARLVAGLLVLALSAIAGCGGDDDGEGGAGVTGVTGTGGAGGAEPAGAGGHGGSEPMGTGGHGGSEPTGTGGGDGGGGGGGGGDGGGGDGGDSGGDGGGDGGDGGDGGSGGDGGGGGDGGEGSGGTDERTEALCDDGLDDDDDELTDCDDPDCAEICAAPFAEVCAAAPAATELVSGDTSSGTDLFQGTCNAGLGLEQLHVYTPPDGQSGTLIVVLESETDQGIYARSVCADRRDEAEIACADINGAGFAEAFAIAVDEGESVSVFVDAYMPGEEGPYTLELYLDEAICGDGETTLPEQCDDANTETGDGCDRCVAELDVLCEEAEVVESGAAIQGDTSTGWSAFTGSCNRPRTRDKVYRFTPPSDGQLTARLWSEADHVLYLRTSCADPGSEVLCVDDALEGEELLDARVAGGEPVYLVVDGYGSPENIGFYDLEVQFSPGP
ncbi:DUF4215 domain-containing protein [Sorangium sp. So ce1036]|uniref:DUF4215 domain-containing protein n=1 Tax=Sorangium sp. So ce1036 TaxID=3133328 RepID=UPI003F0DFF08